MITSFLVIQARAYTIDYWDCNSPTSIQEYDATGACQHTKAQPETVQSQVYLLEQSKVKRVTGYRCTAEVSTFTYFCGAWSHLKVAMPPEIQIPIHITPAQCHYMKQRQQTPESLLGVIRHIDLNEINFFNFISKGNMKTSSSNIECEGEDYRYEGKVLKDSMQLKQVILMVKDEDYLVQGNKIESISDHLQLSCDATSKECSTSDGTFVWATNYNKCPFELIRTLPMEKLPNNHFISHESQILLNATEEVTTECGLKILATNMNSIFMSLDPGAAYLPTVHPEEIDITANILSKVQYEIFMLNNRITKSNKNQISDICEQQLQTSKMMHLKGNKFLHRHGDIIYLTTCPLKTGIIAEKTTCFEEIPLMNGLFVNPITRLSQNVSTPTLCSSHHPMKIKTRENKFITIEPHIRAASIPPQYHLDDEDSYQMTDIIETSIFTAKQLQSWESLQAFPQYKKATMNKLMMGLCLGSQSCYNHNQPSEVTTYSLTSLENKIKTSLWKEIQDIIKEYAVYICLVALLINLANVLITICSLCLTLATAGPQAMVALCYKLCCNSNRQFLKIRRLHQARKQAEDQGPAEMHLNQY
ncbi:MAG: hypothetical protein GY738_10485 [Pseudoalteromonas sp.]|nr:hypothetical protein [Pseudoalteromonas sp.]